VCLCCVSSCSHTLCSSPPSYGLPSCRTCLRVTPARLSHVLPLLLLPVTCLPANTAHCLLTLQAYKAKFRNLHFNLKDAGNPDLRRKVRR
jgi:hypothetical protein